ncbi:MAG: hypothetical protein GY906_12960 [bacterium]|nr:hypothetical protein [bacterium]
MAYKDRELFSSVTRGPDLRCEPSKVQVKTFAPVAGGATLAPLTPIAYETVLDKWVVWANAGVNDANVIRGFVWPDAVELDDSGVGNEDVMGQVVMEGRIHADDIPLPGGELQANLNAALRSGPRDLGLFIYGLDEVR